MPRTPYYVDAAAGSDSNDGLSVATPWQTLTHAAANLPASNWTLYCKGAFHEGNPTFNAFEDGTLTAWPGETHWECNGYVNLTTGAWTDSGSGYYTFNPGVVIGGVGYGYETDRTDDRPRCFIPRAADLATAQSTANRWWQDTGTFLVTVRPHASMTAPTTDGEWCWFRSGNGLRLQECVNVAVRKSKCYGWIGGDTSTGLPSIDTGYGVLVNSGSIGCQISDVEVRGFGGHAFGGVNSQRACTFTRCTARTGRQGIGATAFVFHSNAGGISDELTEDVWDDCHAHCDGLLDVDGVNITSGPLNGFYTHGGSGILPVDVEGRGCTVTCYTDTECRYAFACGETDATIDEHDWASYPVRYTDCTIIDGQGQQLTLGTPASQKYQVAFRRCYFEHSKTSSLATELYAWAIEGAGSRVLLDACVIAGTDDDADTGGFRLVNLANTARVIGINTLFYNTPGASGQRMFFTSVTTPEIHMYGCVFVHASVNGQLIATADLPEANIVFASCWYRGFTSTTGFNNGDTGSTSKSQAQWQANVDAGGVYGTDPQITAADLGAVQPTASGALETAVDATPPTYTCEYGINRRAYSGAYGPWQYGAELVEGDGDGPRSSMRLGIGVGLGIGARVASAADGGFGGG